ncbi:MAG TPA: nucleotide exchange factor GrpE [Thermoanaerobaculia bacterium]|jgi:molecular chaperone GrpE
MADDLRDTGDFSEVALDLDEQSPDLETAMRDAVAAVEGVEAGARPEADSAETGEGADEVARLRQEIADLRDRSMRTLADFDNFRKRSERERQELRRYALLEPMRELLTVADNLDLALSAQGSAEDLKRGVELIHRQMQELMRRFGVTEVAALGQPFDPTQHEAVSREESAEVKAPTVVAELRRGYKMHDRLLRPAMVKVAVPSEGPAPAAGGGVEEGPVL